jgi:hydrogenase maturation protease
VERDVSVPAFPLESAVFGPVRYTFQFPAQTADHTERGTIASFRTKVPRTQAEVRGEVEITAQQVEVELFKIRADISNTTSPENAPARRDEALLHSLVSTHVVFGLDAGDFVSLFEPPDDLKALVSQCQNIGVWPVLVGDPGQHDTLLASPIILYDYPQIAPESVGDLFDGTEIDEILSLRIMTLTDDEKREIRQSDDRARQILERTEAMPAEQFMKLHGAVRGLRPLKESTP